MGGIFITCKLRLWFCVFYLMPVKIEMAQNKKIAGKTSHLLEMKF